MHRLACFAERYSIVALIISIRGDHIDQMSFPRKRESVNFHYILHNLRRFPLARE